VGTLGFSYLPGPRGGTLVMSTPTTGAAESPPETIEDAVVEIDDNYVGIDDNYVKIDGHLTGHRPSKFVEFVTGMLSRLFAVILYILVTLGKGMNGMYGTMDRKAMAKATHIGVRLYDVPMYLFHAGAIIAFTAFMQVRLDAGISWSESLQEHNESLFALSIGLMVSAWVWGLVRKLQQNEVSEDGDADE